MTFDPLAFLDLAEDLRRDSEAQRRTAINRAYYAVFLRARNVASERHWIELSESAADHSRVIRALRAHKNRAAGDELGKLRASREIADYECDQHVSEEMVDDAIGLAQDIRARL